METQTEQQTKLEALQALEVKYKEHAPNGYFLTKKACLGNDVHFYVGLIKETLDCPYQIRDNDKGYGAFTLSDDKGYFTIEGLRHWLSCNPVNPYHAMELKKVQFRKIKANSIDELVSKFDKYLVRYFAMVKEQIANNNIYCQDEVKQEYLNVK